MPNTHIADRDWSYPKDMLKAIEAMNLATFSTKEPIYWLCDNKKTSNLLDFSIIKNILNVYSRTESCLELSSDYSSVIFIINSKIMIEDEPCSLCNIKIEWPYFQELRSIILDNPIPLKTDDDISWAVERFNRAV